MFQTDWIIQMQSLESQLLTEIMRFFTYLGYRNFLVLFLALILFLVDLRKGLVLMQIMLWTGLITVFFKEFFALPRPFHVDSQVKLLDGQLPDNVNPNFEGRDAASFWGLLPEEVLNYYRVRPISLGFPSGHTSIAIALWGATFYLFRSNIFRVFCLLAIILIPFSRIYLGVHFLADVLAGYVIGLSILGLFLGLFFSQEGAFKRIPKIPLFKLKCGILAIPLVLIPIGMLNLMSTDSWPLIGFLLGLNVSLIYLYQIGLPNSRGIWWKRIARFLLAITLFILVGAVLSRVLGPSPYKGFLTAFLSSVAFIGLSIRISLALAWFQRV